MAFTSSIRGSLLQKVIMNSRLKKTSLAMDLNATIHFQEDLDVDIKFKEYGFIYVQQTDLANNSITDAILDRFEALRHYERPFVFASRTDVVSLSLLQMEAIKLSLTLVPVEDDKAAVSYLHKMMKKTAAKKFRAKVWNPENTPDRIHKLTDTITRIDPVLKMNGPLAKSVTFQYNTIQALANADVTDSKWKNIVDKKVPELVYQFFNSPLTNK